MMDEQTVAFLAYVITKGKANITAAEQDRLARLAQRNLQAGDRVLVTLAGGSEVPGAVQEIREDNQVKVTLDASIEAQTAEGMMVVETDTVVVPRVQVRRAPDPAAPTPAASTQ
jgi:preprotein translocase subunit YajC